MSRSQTPLPSAQHVYAALGPRRAPWWPVSTQELVDLTGISNQVWWNWRLRGFGIAPEPGSPYPRSGNRVYYAPAKVLEWLSAGSTPAWIWCRRWAAERHLVRPDESREALAHWLDLFERQDALKRPRKVRLDQLLAGVAGLLADPDAPTRRALDPESLVA